MLIFIAVVAVLSLIVSALSLFVNLILLGRQTPPTAGHVRLPSHREWKIGR